MTGKFPAISRQEIIICRETSIKSIYYCIFFPFMPNGTKVAMGIDMECHGSSNRQGCRINMTILAKVMTGKSEEFVQAIRSLKGDFAKRVNLSKPVLYQQVDDRTAFSLVCDLGTQEDLIELLETEEFKVLLGALTVLCEDSDIRYRYVVENGTSYP